MVKEMIIAKGRASTGELARPLMLALPGKKKIKDLKLNKLNANSLMVVHVLASSFSCEGIWFDSLTYTFSFNFINTIKNN